MSLFISSLNSGSNGNCYYVGNESEAILVDVGISCREVEKRMKQVGLSMQKVKAVFVSHEHSDHIKGISVLIKKFNLPLYISSGTWQNCKFPADKKQIIHFVEDETVLVGSLSVTAFSKKHDAADPFSFTISCNDVTVGVITDIGVSCKNVIKHFKQCHAAFLESNYDEEMLENGNYPYHLKNRIRGGLGHISNAAALQLFLDHKPPFMSHLLLSHLSHNNNCPDLVNELFCKHAGVVNVVVATRHHATEVFQINSNDSISMHQSIKLKKPTQLSLTFE